MTFREKARYVVDRWRPHRGFIAFLAGLTLVSSAVSVAYPLALKYVIDEVERALRSGTPANLASLFVVLALVLVGRFVAGFYPAFRSWMNLRIEADIRAECFDRILEKDYRFQRAFRTGDVVTRLTDDVSEFMKIAWFCCSGIFRAVDSSSKLLFSLAAMLLLDWRLALLSIAPLPLMLWIFYAIQGRLRAAVERQQAAISQTNDLLEAAFGGIKILKAFAAEEGQRRKLARILAERSVVQLTVMKLFSLFQSADAFAARVGQVVALAAGGVLVARGRLELGTLYAFYIYLDMLIHPMQDLPQLLVTARTAFVSVDRLEELRRFPAPAAEYVDQHDSAINMDQHIESMRVSDVSFRYDGADRPALEGVSFEVRRGERLAVVGAVGSGKSTLAKALVGVLRPQAGEIAANGRRVGWRRFRERVGYVPQDAQLFSDSIADNVGLGRAGRPAIDRALEVAQLARDLARFERGADTVLGEKGSLISGGQRQRVAIARALARRPDVLVLDDATAALDARNEERFWASLDREHPGAITIVTSHRLATVRRATRVLFLDRGRVVDSGPHEALLARCPAYRELLAHEARAEHLATA
ncbi:MAG TPA: ABC transporter ATP-binding protein, partial [Planctomycetota bacterium]|nr:ABC transporter ATP-binding protein [Planctomycetota bacterium]